MVASYQIAATKHVWQCIASQHCRKRRPSISRRAAGVARCACGALVEFDAAATSAGQDQWAQCDECGKWREVDGAQLAAIEAWPLRRA
jgi:hypothetical protein